MAKNNFKVYKETEKTWIVLDKISSTYVGEFKSLKIAREVCKSYNKKTKKELEQHD